MPPSFVIVGASLAGSVAAATLRQEGFDGDVTLIGAEPLPPYERPALSKQYLRGEVPVEKLLVRPAAFYEDKQIQTLFGVRATSVDPVGHYVHLDTGRSLRYDKLLITTGVRNRRPAVPGLTMPGVYDLRTLTDADALRHELVAGRRAVVVGMGFIGCEVAASLRAKGVEVVSIEPLPSPLYRVLGAEVGRVLADIHHDHGVQMMFEDGVARVEGDTHAEQVVTTNGRRVECDFVVVGVGVEPVVDFLAGSGIAIDNGVVVDERCRSSAPDIYAAGDVANHRHPRFGGRMRVEHWQNAMQQAAAAARNMLGQQLVYEPVHWFWSDQYDVNLQYAGFHRSCERLVVRGRIEERSFLAFYMNGDRVDAVVGLNRGKEVRRAMSLIKHRQAVDPAQLQDPSIDLRTLVAPALPESGGS